MKFRPSLSLKAFELFLRTQGKVFNAEGFPRYRQQIEERSYPAWEPMPRNFSKLFHAQTQQVNGHPVFTIAPRQGKPQGKPAVEVIYTFENDAPVTIIAKHHAISAKSKIPHVHPNLCS